MDEDLVDVLLVEDEEAHIELVRRAFEPHAGRLQLRVAGSLAEARARLAQSPPHLVIADWVLPDGRGTDLFPLEGEEPHFPLVLMTSYGSEQVAVEAIRGGALDYIVKSPATLADMPHIAQRALREWGYIIERKRAHVALWESEARYRTVIEDMPALVCRFLADGTLTFVNEHYCRYFNKKRDELEGQDFFQFIPEAERESVREHYGSLTPEKPVISYEHQVLAPDGTLRWQHWTDRALFGTEGCPVEYQSIGEDITDLKRAQQERERLIAELQEALAKVRTLSGMLPICASCKKIRDDQGYWNEVESYIVQHSEAEFTHGLCPDCARKLYPELYGDNQQVNR